MNLAQTQFLFRKIIIPFGIVGGVLLFGYTLILQALGIHPLGSYRNGDLVVLLIWLMFTLIQLNFRSPVAPLFWEIFLAGFVCASISLFIYLMATLVWLKTDTRMLPEFIRERQVFVLKNKELYLKETKSAENFNKLLESIGKTSISDVIAGQFFLKGGVSLLISAFLAVAFRVSTLATTKPPSPPRGGATRN
jgi:hypothetical protein